MARSIAQGRGSFAHQVLSGGAWVLATQGAQQVMNLVRSIVLARLLAPEDFGVMSLVSVAITALSVFTEVGISSALVQRRELDDEFLHTAWVLSAVRGAILGLIIFLGAPLAAAFFRTPALVTLMRVMAAVQLLNGLNSLSPTLMMRSLEFRTLAYFGLGYELAGLIAATLAAFLLKSVWAIVIASVASALAALLLSYMLHPYRPRLRLAREPAGELWHFGKHLTGASILAFFCNMGDNAYLGRVLGTEAVGFYDLAYRLGNLPANSISGVFMRVTFPALSSIQDDLERTRRFYLRGLHTITLIAVPICGAMLALAPYIVSVLYGEKWMPAVPAFMALCFFGLERTVNSMTGPVFMAKGRTDFQSKIALLKLGVMALGIVPLTARFGYTGTAIAVALAAVAVWLAVIPWTARLLSIPMGAILKQLISPAVGTLLMMGAILAMKSLLDWPIGLWSLLTLAFGGGLAYLLYFALAERNLARELWQSLATLPPT